MIINDNFVFIHNPHTGGSSIRTMLKSTYPGSKFMKLEDWHMPVESLNNKDKKKIKFGFVRNPWRWYASFYEHQQPNGQFLRLFLDGKSNEFKRFISNMFSNKFIKKHIHKGFHPVGNPYDKKRIHKLKYILNLDIGFFSYRYIYMFFNNYDNLFTDNDKKRIFKDHDKLLSVDTVGKTENLFNDMVRIFKTNKLPINENIISKWKKSPRENSMRKKMYRNYYCNDEDLINLVKFKDRLIINKYNYNFKG